MTDRENRIKNSDKQTLLEWNHCDDGVVGGGVKDPVAQCRRHPHGTRSCFNMGR